MVNFNVKCAGCKKTEQCANRATCDRDAIHVSDDNYVNHCNACRAEFFNDMEKIDAQRQRRLSAKKRKNALVAA